MKVLVLGATGLLGHKLFRQLARTNGIDVAGSVRRLDAAMNFSVSLRKSLLQVDDLANFSELERLFQRTTPHVIINCVAASRAEWTNFPRMVAVFSILPRRVAWLARKYGARFVQISSDGVFSGGRGNYSEDDVPDAADEYGLAKQLGEVNEEGVLNLRTSIIGHSLKGDTGLIDWFLQQTGSCRGFAKSVFSGLPTVEVAKILIELIQRHPQLAGTYHLSSRPVSKHDLLLRVAKQYRKSIDIDPDETVVLDRSLCADKFRAATGYAPKDWDALIYEMHADHLGQ